MDEAQRDRLVDALKKKKKIVVIAGAGISVSANIPDFRSSKGLFAPAGSQSQKLKASGKHLFDAAVYKRDALTEEFHTMVREMAALAEKAEPTPFHHLLASLAQEGRLLRLYSQNIDGLDTGMEPLATNIPLNPKGPWPTTIQLHGGLKKMVCIKCGQLEDLDPARFDGPEAPLCETCKVDDEVRTTHAGKRSHGIGRLRPRFVLYNEYNPDEEAIGNVCRSDLKSRPDAVIVVGTSLKVPGTRRLVKELCQVAKGRKDGFTAWINIDPEPKGVEFKDCWDMVVRSRCDVVANEVDLLPWNFSVGEDYMVSPEQDSENQKRWSSMSPRFEVLVPVKSKQVENVEAIPTPRPSPKLTPAKEKQSKTTKNPGKSKQTQLSFGDQPIDQAKITKPAKKAGGGKRKRPLANSQPKTTVMDTFKATRKVTDSEKEEKQHSSTTGDHTIKRKPSLELSSVRPQRPDWVPILTHKAELPSDPSTGTHGSYPSTPNSPDRPIPKETISPRSVPVGLQGLID
jgi:NAD-dependent histone deacetylase SIR2